MSATESTAISEAWRLQRDLKRIVLARRSPAGDRKRLAEIRRLCRAFRLRDRYCENAVTAIEGCAGYYLSGEQGSKDKQSGSHTLLLTLLKALAGRLEELEEADRAGAALAQQFERRARVRKAA
jgi:hypothetical protein